MEESETTEYYGQEDTETSLKDSRDDLPEQKVIRQEMQKTVRAAVLRLPDKMKVTVLLYYMEERSVEEIAEILRIPKKKCRRDCRNPSYPKGNSQEQTASGQENFKKRIGVYAI